MTELKVLYVTPNAPWPTTTGSAQRSNLLWDALNQISDVRMLCLQSEQSLGAEACAKLKAEFGATGIHNRFGLVAQAPWKHLASVHHKTAARLANFYDASNSRYQRDELLINKLSISSQLADVDLVVGRYLHSVACLGLLDSNKPVLVDVDDLDSHALESAIKAAPSWLSRQLSNRHLKGIKIHEANSLKKAAGAWIANPDDKNHPALQSATILENIPFSNSESDYNTTPPHQSPVVGCLASYGHTPNVEAIDWFLSEVWPTVVADVPLAEFHIYGSQLSDQLKARWHASQSGVVAHGFIEHVSDAYQSMALSVCPVQRGAGTNIKVLEAAFNNRFCLTTESASRGIASNENLAKHMSITHSADDMAKQVVFCLQDRDALLSKTADFCSAFRLNYSREQFNSSVHALVEQVMTGNRVSS